MKMYCLLLLLICNSCSNSDGTIELTLEDILATPCLGEEISLPAENIFAENKFHAYSLSFYHKSRHISEWDTTKPEVFEFLKIQREFEKIKENGEYKKKTTSSPLEIGGKRIISQKPEDFNNNDPQAYYLFQCVPLVYKEYEYRQFSIYHSNGKDSFLIGIYLKNGRIIRCFKTNPFRFKALDFKNIDDHI
ncbi:MAG: hypothetical protein CL840_08370 [Crocinitomicaceae bacterium]|nr:hypothetical protein [Crocinitomicaceae bacterium]|tara:strand:- start:2319 stop:2891 length:573 start_codon:yes stop_codon:yes gene_type:complete